MFWQKDFLARPHLHRVPERGFMAGPYIPSAGNSATDSLLVWVFPPLWLRRLSPHCSVLVVRWHQCFTQPRSSSSLSSSAVINRGATLVDSSSVTGLLSDACCHVFWELDHRTFPGKIPDSYKNVFNRDNPWTGNTFEIIIAGYKSTVRLWYSHHNGKIQTVMDFW